MIVPWEAYEKIAKDRERQIAKVKALPKNTSKSTGSKSKTVSKKKGNRKKGSATRVVDYTSLTNRGNKNATAGKPRRKGKAAMSPEAKELFYDAWQDYSFPKAVLGVMDGVVNAVTGQKLKQDKNLDRLDEVRKSGAFKVGNIGGQMLSYGLGYGGVGKVAGKAAGKMIASKAGKQLITEAAKKKVFQSAAKKALIKQGQNATKKAVGKMATKQAGKVAKGLTKGLVADATVGTVMDSNIARSEGHEIGSKEWNKSMAKNAVLNMGVGGAIEVTPTILRSILKGSKTAPKEVTQRLANGKLKNVKSEIKNIEFDKPKTYKASSPRTLELKKKATGSPKALNADIINDDGFREYLKKNNGGKIVESIAKENGVTINEQTSKMYDSYVKSKDLGADVFKKSTQKANVARYGSERGVVNATPYGETTRGAKTLLNSPNLDDVTKKKLTESINEGTFAKVTKSNKTALDNADSIIGDKGTDGAYGHLKSIVEDGKQPTSENIALGYKLAENYQKTGDYDKVVDVLADVASMESEAGRTLQAMKIFNSLTPEGRVSSSVKMVNRIKKTTGADVKISDELLDNLKKATTESEIAAANKAINVDIWNQIPASWVEKANAWRYLSMLGNPKTHVRNMLGNAIFVPVKGIRNMVASGLEKAVVRNGNRTKAILTPKDKSLIKAGADDFANVKEVLRGQGKYFEGVRDLDSKVFKNKSLEGLRKFNTWALDKEDEIFMKLSYERSFAQYLKANGIKADSIPAEILSKARKYASGEALNSTYRDSAYLAEVLQKMKKHSNTRLKDIPVSNGKEGGEKLAEQVTKKIGSTMVEATVPFTKTPINILKRGIDYSPAGIVKGIARLAKAGGNPEKLIKGISDLSEGLTGTGIMLLGAYAGHSGIAQGSLDTSSNVGKYNKMNGAQPYSIKIGDHTYTMDWAVPVSMPFFVGAEIGDTIDKGVKLSDLVDSLSKITDPIFNLSMLSGLNNVLDTAYKNTDNSAVETLKNMGESYVGQFLPTVGGQISRTLTDETKTTTSTLENKTMRDLKRFYNQMKNKVPGLSDTNQPLVDNWGHTEGKYGVGDYAKAALLNFLSPGTLKSTEKDTIDSELSDLMKNLSDEEAGSIVPKSTSKYTVKFSGAEYRMTEKELADFKKARGQEANYGLSKLFEKDSYQNKSNDEKAKAIKDVYDKALKEAQYQFLKGRGASDTDIHFDRLDNDVKMKYEKSKGVSKEKFVKSYNAQRSVQSNVAKAVAVVNAGGDYKTLRTINKDIPQSTFEKAKALSSLGFTAAEVKKIGRQADSNKNGSRTNAEITAYLSRHDYTQEEKRRLFTALANWNARNPY